MAKGGGAKSAETFISFHRPYGRKVARQASLVTGFRPVGEVLLFCLPKIEVPKKKGHPEYVALAGSLKCVRNCGGCGTRQFLWYKNSDSNSPRPFSAISNTFQATPTGAQGQKQTGSASHSLFCCLVFDLAVDLPVPLGVAERRDHFGGQLAMDGQLRRVVTG